MRDFHIASVLSQANQIMITVKSSRKFLVVLYRATVITGMQFSSLKDGYHVLLSTAFTRSLSLLQILGNELTGLELKRICSPHTSAQKVSDIYIRAILSPFDYLRVTKKDHHPS